MKTWFIIFAVLLIIGTFTISVRSFKKDTLSVATTTVATNENSVDTIVVTPQDVVKPETVHINEPQIAHEGPEFTIRTWAGKYQIVEFGEVIPDSNPMKYDAYAYTDFIVTNNGLEYDVSILLTNKDGRKTALKGYGVININKALEVYSEKDKLLFILEDYTKDRMNADTKFTWVDLKPQLDRNMSDSYYIKRQDLE